MEWCGVNAVGIRRRRRGCRRFWVSAARPIPLMWSIRYRSSRLRFDIMLTPNPSPLRTAWFAPIALLASVLTAQTPDSPKPVPMTEEPHHRLIFENSYVRVFRFSLPGHEATLLHPHDLPYVSVTLGAVDAINAVAGKPESHVVLTDGQVGYSHGGFAHIVRTDPGSPYNNLTIELLHPQGELRNLCQKITDGPLNDCPSGNVDKLPAD